MWKWRARTNGGLVINSFGELESQEILNRIEDCCRCYEQLPVSEPALGLGKVYDTLSDSLTRPEGDSQGIIRSSIGRRVEKA
jgi:hypothetical protein